MYQTRQVIAKHIKKWPRVSQTSMANIDSATCPSGSTASTGSRQATLRARDLDFPGGATSHGDAQSAGRGGQDYFDFEPADYGDEVNAPADEQHAPAPAHATVQQFHDFNFCPVVLPDVRAPGSDQDQEDRQSLTPRAFQERPGV